MQENNMSSAVEQYNQYYGKIYSSILSENIDVLKANIQHMQSNQMKILPIMTLKNSNEANYFRIINQERANEDTDSDESISLIDIK